MKLFGTQRLQSLLGITVLALTLGCSNGSDIRQASGDIKARLPMASEGGAYSLKEVTLQSIHSLYQFAGHYANFFIYPAVTGDRITGYTPKTRFLKSGDLWVPEDVMTQQMAVIYYHLQNFAALDVELGAEGVNTWPRDVGVAVRYSDAGKTVVNNAFYDGNTDSMLVVPYTDDHLPIPVNAGILAHEHFHSLYFKLVEKPLFKARQVTHGEDLRNQIYGRASSKIDADTKIPNPAYHQAFSRGINEGLADFWAWIYTGDPDFLATSLPSEKMARTLNMSGTPAGFTSAAMFRERLAQAMNPRSAIGEDCRGMRVAYCLGTEYARALKHLSVLVQESRGISSIEARHMVGKAIIQSLPMLKEKLLSLQNLSKELQQNAFLEPGEFFSYVQKSLPDLKDAEKEYLSTLSKPPVKPVLDETTMPKIAVIPALRGER